MKGYSREALYRLTDRLAKLNKISNPSAKVEEEKRTIMSTLFKRLAQLKHIPTLNEKERKEKIDIVNTVVVQYIPLARSKAGKYYNSPHYEDLLQEAFIAMHTQANNFDFGLSRSFSNYAQKRIRAEMRREMDRKVRYNQKLQEYRSISNQDNSESADDNIDRKFLLDVVGELPDKTKEVIEMRFGLRGRGEHTLEEIGEELGLTRERIRQIQNNGLKMLEKKLAKTDFY